MTDTPTHTQTETMSDAEPEETIDEETEWTTDGSDQGTDPSPTSTGSTGDAKFDPDVDAVQRYLAWGALGVCSLLAVFALVQFYGSVTETIDLWVDPKYQPMIHAAFNLAVLLTSLIGVSRLVRELQ